MGLLNSLVVPLQTSKKDEVLVGLGFCVEKSPEEGNMVEGDMELSPDQMAAFMEQMEKKKNSFASIKAGLWLTNGKADTIKYYIDPQISGASSVIAAAVADYHKHTCLKFQKYSSKPSGPHIFFTTGSGCSSPVGRRSYGNSIRLARGCWYKGTVMHEIGHSIGLFHEQSRPDRDNYVTINWNNIVDRAKFNFNKLTTSRIDSRGTPYDYDSMMHYGSYFFSKNRQITIQTKNSEDQNRIGNRKGFSKIDIQQINKMYGCQGGSSGGNSGGSGGNSGGSGSCVDTNTNCPGWEKYCGNHSYVDKHCKKTCNTCGGDTCNDKDKRCPGWKSYCTSNSYVKTNCKKSCNTC